MIARLVCCLCFNGTFWLESIGGSTESTIGISCDIFLTAVWKSYCDCTLWFCLSDDSECRISLLHKIGNHRISRRFHINKLFGFLKRIKTSIIGRNRRDNTTTLWGIRNNHIITLTIYRSILLCTVRESNHYCVSYVTSTCYGECTIRVLEDIINRRCLREYGVVTRDERTACTGIDTGLEVRNCCGNSCIREGAINVPHIDRDTIFAATKITIGTYIVCYTIFVDVCKERCFAIFIVGKS